MRYRGGVETVKLSCAERSIRAAVALTALATIASAGPPRTGGLITTTVTMLAEHPGGYAGKWVSVKSRVILGRGPLILTEGQHRILISQPGSSEVGKVPFNLIQDANWQELNEAVAPHPPPAEGGMVIAVVEGRFDSKAAIGAAKEKAGRNAHRLVIHRVTSVEVVPNP